MRPFCFLTKAASDQLKVIFYRFQTDKWGSVEWSHDLELHDTTSRLAAAALFVQLSRSQHLVKEKF